MIFDLDGTLIDSKLDLAHAVNATRVYMGFEPITHDLVYSYVGNGAPVLIRRALPAEVPDSEIDRALGYFLNYYREHKLDYTVLYPGVQESLDTLREAGRKMAVLTNKPVRISQEIIDELGLQDHFFRVYGGNSFEQKKPDPVGIEKLLAETGIARERTLMIGDSAVDIRTARNAQVASCGVTWGFQPDTLAGETAPDVLVERMVELTEYVLG